MCITRLHVWTSFTRHPVTSGCEWRRSGRVLIMANYYRFIRCKEATEIKLYRTHKIAQSVRLSRPPGFVEFTAVCAPVLPLVGTVFVCNVDVALYWVIQLGQPIMWSSLGTVSVAFCAAVCVWMSTRKAAYFLRTLRANKLVCNDVFLTCFPPCDVWFYARFAVPVCSLFRGRFWCHFDVNLWVKFLLFRRLFVSFSEPLPTYYRVRNKRHLSAHFMMCSTKWRRRSTHTHKKVNSESEADKLKHDCSRCEIQWAIKEVYCR